MSQHDIKMYYSVSSRGTILMFAIGYAIIAKLSFLFSIQPGNISPIFPAAGIALAAALIFGRPALFAVWLGSFIANALFFFDGMHGTLLPVHSAFIEILISAIIGSGAAMGANLGASMIDRICKSEYPLSSGWNVLMLVTVCSLASCLISPTVGVISLAVGGYIPWEGFGYSWLTWWVGDVTGTIIFAPFFLAWYHKPIIKEPLRHRTLEIVGLGVVTLLLCSFVFSHAVPFEYLLMPILLWAAFRFGMRGVTTVAVVIMLFATISTSHGSGPFVWHTVNGSLLLLYAFLEVTVICALYVAGVLAERQCAEIAVRDAKEVAESANKSKSQFLANMSHELRTPLNAILGMTDLVLMTNLNEMQKQNLDFVKSGAQRLLALVNDILDLAKIESASMELEQITFAIKNLIHNSIITCKTLIGDKPVIFEYIHSDDIPEMLIGDPLRLYQILTNLLGNAIKFTQVGKIRLTVALEKITSDSVTLKFSVTDSGIGIPENKREKLFKYFSQIDASITKKYGGAGLGLAISRALVAEMEGTIWVESALGQGSTFHFTANFKLPLEAN